MAPQYDSSVNPLTITRSARTFDQMLSTRRQKRFEDDVELFWNSAWSGF